MSTEFPVKKIRNMLHALGISHHTNGDYIQPNKRYSPYPTSYRNYYQIKNCELWNDLVTNGFAEFRKGQEGFGNFYFVTDSGKEHLKSMGYKWHERK